jgi:hypothetical protein
MKTLVIYINPGQQKRYSFIEERPCPDEVCSFNIWERKIPSANWLTGGNRGSGCKAREIGFN